MNHFVPSSGEAHSSQSQRAHLRVLRGTQVGQLDPSQLSRLLRFPDSKLSFASFDPRTALTEDPSVQKSGSSSNLAPPKRVVIETTPNGASFWRFVPRARLEEGAQDEGVWPRVIDICGEKVQCYQEQWEIYKLDPKYHCVVYLWPKCSTVTWVELVNQEFDSADLHSGKRSRWPSPSPEASVPVARKKARSRPLDKVDGTDSDSDEDEVEDMIIDESFSQKPRSRRRPCPASRDEINKARFDRWAKNRITREKRVQDTTIPADNSFSMRVDSEGTIPSQSVPWPSEENIKRTSDSLPESDNEGDQTFYGLSPHGHKRARTLPTKVRNDVNQNRSQRERRRPKRSHQHVKVNHQYQQEFAESLRAAFIPPGSVFETEEEEESASSTETHSSGNGSLEEVPLEDGATHEAEIAASIRKLRELEKDRPIWEAQRKQREACERAEEQERLVRAERRRREEEERLRQQREAAEREKRLAQQEAERLAREELRQREIRQQRQRRRWESGPWTTHRALERYRLLSDEFDAAKFMPGQSLTFHDIPWPVLHAPSHLTVEDVDWSAVETFFVTVRRHMRPQDYKEFVEKSHRRFHPDRWRARKIWTAVTDEIERGYLEVAANTVAQAITPIWRATKDK